VIPAFLYPLLTSPDNYTEHTYFDVDKATLAFTPSNVTLTQSGYNLAVGAASLTLSPSSVTLTPGTADTVALSGTLGAPNTYYAFSQYPGGSAKEYLRANTNGKLEEATSLLNGTLGAYNQIGTQWVVPLTTYVGNYWIRATKISGDNLTSGTLNSWISLNSNSPEWQLTAYKSQALGGIDYKEILLKLEIATDAGGSTIVATGYYELQAEYDTLV
jgi:hypothetical protein